jgi:D-lactate dehydrogenase
VLLTPHQAFLTKEALQIITERTIHNLDQWIVEEDKKKVLNRIPAAHSINS